MCHAILCCPLFHASSDSIGNLAVELYAIVHHINHFLVCILGQVLVHFLAREDFFTKEL